MYRAVLARWLGDALPGSSPTIAHQVMIPTPTHVSQQHIMLIRTGNNATSFPSSDSLCWNAVTLDSRHYYCTLEMD